jgi:hypothetical protein
MGLYPSSRANTLAVAELPQPARAFAELPYGPCTELSRQYHLRTYEAWCAQHGEEPWPPTLERLLRFGADRATTKAYYTVREHIRNVSLVERKRTGTNLYGHPSIQMLLRGLKRERPPAPVRPLRPSQIHALLAYEPRYPSQRQVRVMILLSYAAGFTLRQHSNFRCEMITFNEQGAFIDDLDVDRPHFFIGRAKDLKQCPVAALELLVGGRTSGPVYRSKRYESADRAIRYDSMACQIINYGKTAGVHPISADRVRLAGLLEQVQHIDVVRLAHFHGYRHVEPLADLLGRYVAVPHYRKRARRA